MARYNSQEDARFGMILFDQWGRRYFAEVEKETLYPTGPITPMFTAPITVDTKYVRPYGRNAPNRVHVDLDGLERDLADKHERNRQRVQKATMKHFPGWTKKTPPEAVIEQIYGDGRGPMPVRLVHAMRQGNRWVLGLTEHRPDWSKEPEFSDWIDAPVRETSGLMPMDREFPDVEGIEDLALPPVAPITDENVAPGSPQMNAQGLPDLGAGYQGSHQSWGNVERNRTVEQVESFVRK